MRYGWFVGLWMTALPVNALTLAVKTIDATVTIEDNTDRDQDPQLGSIRYQGTVAEASLSPLEMTLVAREVVTEAEGVTLALTESTLSNLGEPTDLEITLTSGPLELAVPMGVTMTYNGVWSDETDGRQALAVSRNQWQLSSGSGLIQEMIFEPITQQGETVKFGREVSFEHKKPTPRLESRLRLNAGVGDTLSLAELEVKAQGQGGIDPRWLALGGVVLVLILLSLGWLRGQARP